MAQKELSGLGPDWPLCHLNMAMPPSFTSSVFNATGNKVAMVGRVWWPDRTSTSKSIRKVHFRFGSVTKAGGSALTFSLQDASTSGGPPAQPDGTQDQTYAIANGDAGFASNTWYTTGNLSADRTVSLGDRLAAVWEYDGAGRLGADTVAISGITLNITEHGPQTVTYNGATWSGAGSLPNIVFEFSDGTFGTLYGAFPASALNSVAYKQDTGGADEYALEFTVSEPIYVDGCYVAYGHNANTADFDMILYNGTTQIASVGVDANEAVGSGGAARLGFFPFAASVALLPGNTYRLAATPNQTAATINLYYWDVSAAGHFACHSGETGWGWTSRLDLGSWAAKTTTRRPFMGLTVSRLDTGDVIIARRAGPVVARVAGPNRKVFVISGGGGGVTQNVIVTRPRRIM